MTSRERILKAARREQPDRVPRNLRPSPQIRQQFHAAHGDDANMDEFYRLDLRFVGYKSPGIAPTLADWWEQFKSEMPEGDRQIMNSWGTLEVGGKGKCNALQFVRSSSEINDFPLPSVLDSALWTEVASQVETCHAQGLAAVSSYQPGTFETCQELRGIENILIDSIAEPEMMESLTGRVAELLAGIASRYVEAGVDMLWIGDDLGGQEAPLFAPSVWRQWYQPALRRIIDSARSVRDDILIAYHSCGHVAPFVGELVETGIDVLESVQPEAQDIFDLKRRFGDRLAFWGGVGAQSVLSWGSPAEVDAAVRRVIEIMGEGGGLIVSPAHTVEPPTPWENVEAFFAACDRYGNYPVAG